MDSGCEKFAAKLIDLLEKEGDAASRREALAHMARCKDCESEYRAYERLSHALTALGESLYARVPAIEIRPLSLENAPQFEEVPQVDDGALGTELRALAHELSAGLPVIDIREEVMASVRVMRQQEEANPGLTPELQMDFQAYMEDSLDAVGHARLEAAVDDYPAVRREFEALRGLKEDLLAIGRQIDAATPRIDLLRADARDSSQPSPILTNTRSSRERRLKKSAAPPALSWLGLAAAACLVLGLWLTAERWLPQVPDKNETIIADTTPADDAPDEEVLVADAPKPPGPRDKMPEIEQVPLPELLAQFLNDDSDIESPEDGQLGFDVDDVLEARRDASSRLAVWASLTADQARNIVESSGATVEQLLGAVKFLEREEARKILEAAISAFPDSAALRAALAKNYASDAAKTEAFREQLAAWSALDPENALPLYKEAQLLLDQGYGADALNLLAMAGERDAASAYGLEGMNQHRAALIAAGVDPNLAGLLAASTAGSEQYSDVLGSNDIDGLSRQLLAQGRQYEAAGDFETAEQIYEAVRQLGVQIENGASLTDERLAGATVQHEALQALGAIVSPEEWTNWALALTELGANISNTLIPLRDALDSAYSVMDSGSVGSFVDFVTSNGDILLGESILDVTEGLAESLTNSLLQSIFN